AGNETLGVDTGGQGNFFVKVPADKRGKVITFEVPRGVDPATQRPRTERYPLRFFFTENNWYYERTGGLRGTLQGLNVFLIDTNLNGRFDDVGTDLLVLGNEKPVPLTDSITVNKNRVLIKLDPGGGGPFTLTPVPYPDELARAHQRLNRWREQLGLPPIAL